MCARRFLMLILILTLIAVGGAFALYRWGSDALVRMATPQGHFQPPPRNSAPDYSKADAWIARPDIADNPSQWLPSRQIAFAIAYPPAAVFYVHPTTYLERDRWNAPLRGNRDADRRAELFVQSQGSALTSAGHVWAPRYRQAAYGAFLLKSPDATKALDLAYSDVLAAFDQMLRALPGDKAIILAGHSQGSLHLLRMLADRKEALKGRLVAAYVIGWPVGVSTDLPATSFAACKWPRESGCVLSWQSFKEPENTKLVTKAWVGTKGLTGAIRSREEMLCTNPLLAMQNSTAPPGLNQGTLVPDGSLTKAELQPGRVGAACKNGFLIIFGDVPDLGPYVLPGNNYHVYDYALFWGSIRIDAVRRLDGWRQH